MDSSQDPDRFVPDDEPAGSLDPAQDPDRFSTSDRTLPELLGEGAYEDERDPMAWLVGLAAVIGFLVLVSLLVELRG